jgi:hypothetical protein
MAQKRFYRGFGRLARVAAAATFAFVCSGVSEGESWIAATDESRVKRTGEWSARAFRRASGEHLFTQQDGAALEVSFTGSGIVLTLDAHGLPFAHLGTENLGSIAVTVDGGSLVVIEPVREDRDVVLARGLPNGAHKLRLVHRGTAEKNGCRIAGFRILHGGEGGVSFLLHGEANRFLTDVRVVVSRGGKVVRNSLARNWLTGQCRLAGLPEGRGYELKLIASGWQTHRIGGIEIVAEKETALPPVYIGRTRESTVAGVQFPHMGQPAILRSGGSFATRMTLGPAAIDAVELRRRAGPAAFTRRVVFRENKALAYDGKVEGSITLPDEVPPGLYDLVYTISQGNQKREQVSPRSVHVVKDYPSDPVFVTFGHMDTWGQEQAEYLELLAGLSNLIGADMVLVSNEVNAAYAAGAFSRLEVPYLINFGNHGVGGHEEWYGNGVSLLDFGPDFSILNFTHTWHGDLSHAYALLESRAKTRCKIINAFEHDAPVEEMLDRYSISFLHEAHGPNPKVTTMGRTPTQRAGKENSESFRVVRFKGCRPVSFTYAGHPSAPIPLPRHKPSPLRLSFSPANDGIHRSVTARVENGWAQEFPNSRVTFVMPKGQYALDNARLESVIASDDGRFVVLTARFDVQPKSVVELTARPRY